MTYSLPVVLIILHSKGNAILLQDRENFRFFFNSLGNYVSIYRYVNKYPAIKGEVNLQSKLGIKAVEIMLPNKEVDLNKWAVIACDQYTSNRAYWQELEDYVADQPSTLKLVYPEVYLNDDDKEKRIKEIGKTMEAYLKQGLFTTLSPQFIYVERTDSSNKVRKGLLVALDLEDYDYNLGAKSLTRATEGTVLDRLPPRIAIRREALLESPHIMVLIDDPDRSIIEPLADKVTEMEKLYDFDLMMKGGHIKGYSLKSQSMIEDVYKGLARLADPDLFKEKYKLKEEKPLLLFAVGDGNHSLATAKAYWEELKASLSADMLEDHPARYALVELVNVHDDGLEFEPIHRCLFNIDPDNVLKSLVDYNKSQGIKTNIIEIKDRAQAIYSFIIRHKNRKDQGHIILYSSKDKYGLIEIENPVCNLEVGSLQAFLDDYLKKHTEANIDYIHGDKETLELADKDGCMGFLLPVMEKHDLFTTVILDGVLPRKTFSMGHADDKRFYLECRKITK